MKNEILEELWRVKDEVFRQHGNDIELLAKDLLEKEKKEDTVVDFSQREKHAA